MKFKVNRPWQLHVWDLHGLPETWEAQLRARLSAEPVFAAISGVGGANWAPVHRFCEAQSLPCLFPNVDLPVVAENDFDNLYFSKGVLLEAQLLARELKEHRDARVRRVVQVFRAADVGKAAAGKLADALSGEGLTIIDRSLPQAGGARDLAGALRGLNAQDALGTLAAAGRPCRPRAAAARAVFRTHVRADGRPGASAAAGRVARGITRIAYPFDLPELRRVRVDYPLGWFSIRKIPVVAQQAQTDTWLACGILSDAINHMADTFVRDYLVERIEEMLEHRIVTGYSPGWHSHPASGSLPRGATWCDSPIPRGRRSWR